MTRALPWSLLALAVAVLVCWGQWSERRIGRAEERVRVAEVARDSALRVSRRLDTVYVAQVRTLTRWRDSLVTLRDSLTITDTLEVVRFIAVQDSTLLACGVALTTCEHRVAAVWGVAEAFRAERDATRALVGRPTTSIGLSLGAGGYGLTGSRDWWRVRVSADVTVGSARLGVGWRW